MAFILLLQVVIHAPYLSRPAMGTHVWRQANTLAVARNYAEEDMRIWLPRIDKRYQFSGTTGPSFTAYEYSLAVIYRYLGFSQSAHRWLSLFFSLLAIAGMFYLARSFLPNNIFASFSALSLLSIPEFYYHSINAIPDLLALTFMLWGWYFAREWLRRNRINHFILATVLLALAGMVKLQFLVCGAPLAAEVLYNKTTFKFRYFAIAGMVAVTLGASFLWYRYAHYLTYQYWLIEFVHDVRLPESVPSFFIMLFKNLFSDLPETWAGYGVLTGLIVGLFLVFKNKVKWHWAIFSIAASFIIYFLLQRQFLHHGYYILYISPFIALTAAYGFYRLVGTQYSLIILFLLLSPIWAILRMVPNWSQQHSRIPVEFLNIEFQQKAQNFTDTSKRYIVGPDQTGCVFFYYLHAKGFPWYNTNDGIDDMTKWMRLGATGLITNRPDLLHAKYSDSIAWQLTAQQGGFYWYSITLKKP